ncbi:ENTH domain-containing protein [Forsythia ovata]|uniref:ENTH domain-containing protein n=1 Tax=Forsythia ovata TaxID=205694 RepID=A0ABD1T536_9LAMI
MDGFVPMVSATFSNFRMYASFGEVFSPIFNVQLASGFGATSWYHFRNAGSFQGTDSHVYRTSQTQQANDGEDYRATQYQIMQRLSSDKDFADQIGKLNSKDSSELIDCLKRLENCMKRLTEIFGNTKRHDAFWELISQRKKELEKMNRNRGRLLPLVWKGRNDELIESTRFVE